MPSSNLNSDNKNGAKRFSKAMKVAKDIWWLAGVVFMIVAVIVYIQLLKFETDKILPIQSVMAEVKQDLKVHVDKCKIQHESLTKEVEKCSKKEVVETKLDNIEKDIASIDKKQEEFGNKLDDLKDWLMKTHN